MRALTKTQEMVAGFVFNKDMSQVVMVEKLKPDWQKGKLNAVGGKIEFGEHPIEAMTREFEEETGLQVEEKNWKRLTTLTNNETFVVYFYYTLLDTTDLLPHVSTMEEEKIIVLPIEYVKLYPRINNIDLLLEMAMYQEKEGLVLT